MSDLKLAGEDTIEVAGRTVIVRELTLAELRAHLVRMASAEGGWRDALEVYLIEGWDMADVPLFTDLTVEDLAPMRPSEIRKVMGAIERMNPDFFIFRAKARRSQVEAQGMSSQSLSEPSPT